MEYVDYISQDNARREREQQLKRKFNQKTEPMKVADKEDPIWVVMLGMFIVSMIILAAIAL